jgi:hypothetical protein
MSFWSNLGAEFAARRRRFHRGPMKSFANPIEFAVLGGFVLAAVAPIVARNGLADVPWGPVLPLAMLAVYFFVDAQRQRALAGGGDSETVSAAFDKRVHRLFLIVALLGAATFAWALFKPAPQTFLPEEPPAAGSFDVDIGP